MIHGQLEIAYKEAAIWASGVIIKTGLSPGVQYCESFYNVDMLLDTQLRLGLMNYCGIDDVKLEIITDTLNENAWFDLMIKHVYEPGSQFTWSGNIENFDQNMDFRERQVTNPGIF